MATPKAPTKEEMAKKAKEDEKRDKENLKKFMEKFPDTKSVQNG